LSCPALAGLTIISAWMRKKKNTPITNPTVHLQT
jgi:hypothetical protein